MAGALGVDPAVEVSDYIVGADVTLIIGADWPGVAAELRPPTPGLVPTTTSTSTTSTTLREGGTTTTS
ncbi:MAG TPA: hypothetical protein VLB84_09270, partial [Bacteroidia bacterium]|nr:hypothetical protein [Bacteroidia bacterium]